MATELLIDHATGFRVEEVNIGGASPRRELRLTVETSAGPTLITIEAPSIYESGDRESLLDKLEAAVEWVRGGGGMSARDGSADGMTLRDYFAAKALQGDMACEGLPASNIPEVYSRLAEVYYQVADAMLEARKQEGGS